jgi:hypothetical protein
MRIEPKHIISLTLLQEATIRLGKYFIIVRLELHVSVSVLDSAMMRAKERKHNSPQATPSPACQPVHSCISLPLPGSAFSYARCRSPPHRPTAAHGTSYPGTRTRTPLRRLFGPPRTPSAREPKSGRGVAPATNSEQTMILQNDRLPIPKTLRNPPPLLPIQHHAPKLRINSMIPIKP